MSDLQISIEGASPELDVAYAASGMERGLAGSAARSWAFGSNATPFAVARRDGQIVGVSAYIQSRMKLATSVGTGFQAVDSFVSSEMRGQGVFSALARRYDQHAADVNADLVWGFPNDNAAPAWFGKLGWQRHGQVPFLIKPLRSGYFLRKFGLPGDFPVSFACDQNLIAQDGIGPWADALWQRVEADIGCATIRDREYLSHRLFGAPHAARYRVVADTGFESAALVATSEAEKHGGKIAYLMEALGGESLKDLLMSELGRLRNRGTELVLAWSFPGSPNFKLLRQAGFFTLPERLRPIHIWFGSRPKTPRAANAVALGQWYLSYLDSDTT